ncbi:MAG: metallophosphoesterase [Candidatus Omnitrophica bacterium]|nr:metallophosphoesterase [Candidatus Omnitrophota bacterium]
MSLMRMKKWRAALCCGLCAVLTAGPVVPVNARETTALGLPVPGTLVTVSEQFSPAVLKGMTVHPEEPFRFDFIIDTGDSRLGADELQSEADKLIRYFMAALTVPEKQLWVNLSPYEQNRIIPPVFGETEMGRDLLAQDYLLKQLTASMIYPESELGARFWQRVHARARERFGSDEIPVDTFNKIWIVPQTADLYVSGRNVFVVESRLKVMLEEDYVALRHNAGHHEHGVGKGAPDELSPAAALSAQIVREIVIPEIEQEVNFGRNFANLRQIFHSLILAAWYKQNLKESVFARSYVDQGKTDGIVNDDPAVNRKIYDQYVAAYKRGVYNYIREDYDVATQSAIPRKYFSGGVEADVTPVMRVGRSVERLGRSIKGELVTATAFARASHLFAHQQGGFAPILADIAAEIGIVESDGVYPFVPEVRARGGRIALANGGRLELTADGILTVIDPRFQGDHAGRGTYQLAVYARNEAKARHELAELRALIATARELGVISKTETNAQLGAALQAWANDASVDDSERLARQNRLITAAHQAHRLGLIAEGQAQTARQAAEPVLLTRPVSGFDITIASDGAQALRIYHFLKFLGEQEFHPLLLSTARVAAAAIQRRPGLLVRAQDLTPDIIEDTFARLNEFTTERLESVLLSVPGLSMERINLFRQIGVIIGMAAGQRDEADVEAELEKLRGMYPELFENALAGVDRLRLRRRLHLLNRVERRYHAGDLPTVLSFGDKHGRTADLEKILERTRAAARTGEQLTVVGHGDAFDRGTNNVRVLRILQELKQLEAEHDNITVKLLLGNHETWLLKSRMAVLREDEEVWILNGGEKTLDEFAREPGGIEGLMRFILDNFDVYYIDDWGMLHIHGGFEVGAQGDPVWPAERLVELQAQLEEYRANLEWDSTAEFPDAERRPLRQLMHDIGRMITVSRESWDQRFRDIRVEMDPEARETMYQIVKSQIMRIPGNDTPTEAELRAFFNANWKAMLIANHDMYYSLGLVFDIDDSRREEFLSDRLDRFMAGMGVLGVINGHHHHLSVMNADQRIFGIDVDDIDAGHMIMDAGGVTFYPVNREGAEQLVEQREMIANWEEQRQRLHGYYAEHDLLTLLNAGKLKPPSDEDAAMLVRINNVEINAKQRNSYVQAAADLVDQIAQRGVTRLLFTGPSAFISMELIREQWQRSFGSLDKLPEMHVIDDYAGLRSIMVWYSGDLTRNLRRHIPRFNVVRFRQELREGRVALIGTQITGGTTMKKLHRLFKAEFGVTPAIGALVASHARYRQRKPFESWGEFDVMAGAVNGPLADLMNEYISAQRQRWEAEPPYRTKGVNDPLVEAVREGIRADAAVLVGASHYDYSVGEGDRIADAVLNLVEKTAGAGIVRVFFTGTSAFVSRELFVEAWNTRFGETIALPELLELPSKRLYTLWRAGDLPKELLRLYPRLDLTRLVEQMEAGQVALIDDHAASGAKLRSLHRIFVSDMGAAPVMGALVSRNERYEHFGFNSAFGGFNVMYGLIDFDLPDKLGAYTQSHREQWLGTPPYRDAGGQDNNVTDALVEAIRRRLQVADQAALSETPGGIDLNPQAMTITVSGDAAPLITPVDATQIVPEVEGYVPFILPVTPAANLPVLLGGGGEPTIRESISYLR